MGTREVAHVFWRHGPASSTTENCTGSDVLSSLRLAHGSASKVARETSKTNARCAPRGARGWTGKGHTAANKVVVAPVAAVQFEQDAKHNKLEKSVPPKSIA